MLMSVVMVLLLGLSSCMLGQVTLDPHYLSRESEGMW